MADNYLERREEEIRQGHGFSYGKSVPNLEQLIRRSFTPGEFDSSYHVHALQLEAIMSVASMVPCEGVTIKRLSEDCSTISLPDCGSMAIIALCCDSDNGLGIGEIIMSIRLKAAAMNLHAKVFPGDYGLGKQVKAIVAIGKQE